uniref:Uncharacterized protein AlNc14C76G5085 n=1 Tax=Albugo laibachii Nc14 TaxID=890382 RepID=F0WEN5_9STRA|nr:conserved hypothetical protein [Albugo laibachii Nc14]|eukprot:CCA19667.1 conserved hypothetical protein [Albugo laibachii Nc14]
MGLEVDFSNGEKVFVRQVSFSERACGFSWHEEIKVECWWSENQTLEHAMQRLLQTFSTKITPAQSMKLFTAPKAVHRSWTDHFLYLTAVSDACGGSDDLVLEKIVHYADPSARMMMLSQIDIHRMEFLRQVDELCQFAQSTEIEARTKQFGREVLNACYRCGNVGHLKATCPYRKKKVQQEGFSLAIGRRGQTSKSHWILDGGSSRHLVNDLNSSDDLGDFNSECLAAASDGEPLRITKQGSVVITVKALGARKPSGFSMFSTPKT